MTRIRLLPIVLFGVTALLCLKLLGLVAGIGSFAIGPSVADAAGGAPAEHGEPAAEAAPALPEVAEQPARLRAASRPAPARSRGAGRAGRARMTTSDRCPAPTAASCPPSPV